MTEIIGVRTFWWEDEPERRITVSLGKPAQTPEEIAPFSEFYCPIQITGFGDEEHIETIHGVDAFQALELAMRYIGYRLSDIDQKSGGRLRWAYGDNQRIRAEWAQQNP